MNLLVSKWIRSCVWGGEGRGCAGMRCRDCFGDPWAHGRRVFKALVDSWRQLCNHQLSNISDMTEQTLLSEMQTGSLSVLAKDDKRCSGGCISEKHQKPSLKWQSWPPLPPWARRSRVVIPEPSVACVLDRGRRSDVYSCSRLPQGHFLSLHITISQTLPLKSHSPPQWPLPADCVVNCSEGGHLLSLCPVSPTWWFLMDVHAGEDGLQPGSQAEPWQVWRLHHREQPLRGSDAAWVYQSYFWDVTSFPEMENLWQCSYDHLQCMFHSGSFTNFTLIPFGGGPTPWLLWDDTCRVDAFWQMSSASVMAACFLEMKIFQKPFSISQPCSPSYQPAQS